MKRLVSFLVALAVVAPALAAQEAPARRRVAVFDFDYATVHSYVTDLFGSDVDIGKGIADMLVTELVGASSKIVETVAASSGLVGDCVGTCPVKP